VAVTGLLACLAGCASVTVGSAQPGGSLDTGHGSTAPSSGTPAPGSGTAKPGPQNRYGAPKVTQPLDVTKYVPQPCTALTTAQRRALGLTKTGQTMRDSGGSTCSIDPKYDVVYTIAFNTHYDGEPQGLANAYWNADGPGFTKEYMRRLPDISGVPEVTEPDQNTNGACYIYLGATDQVSYAAGVTVSSSSEPQYRKACSIAHQLAVDITGTMRSGK
jgi:uncharacterized protein DUF3558